jgi:hypothetical protein
MVIRVFRCMAFTQLRNIVCGESDLVASPTRQPTLYLDGAARRRRRSYYRYDPFRTMRTHTLLILLGTLLVGAVMVPYVREVLAVDSCLDGGGSFDYLVGTCDHDQNHRHIAFRARHGFAAPSVGIGSALVVTALILRKRRARGGFTS